MLYIFENSQLRSACVTPPYQPSIVVFTGLRCRNAMGTKKEVDRLVDL